LNVGKILNFESTFVEMYVAIILATNMQYAIYKRLTLNSFQYLELCIKMVCVLNSFKGFELKMKKMVCANKFGTKYIVTS
jgi:hypothetical protein